MDSEVESEECAEEEGSEKDSESGVASLALGTTFVSKSIFNLEENNNAIYTDDYADDIAPTYCFMAKGSKVPNDTSSSHSSDCEPDDYKKNSYSKLANIATKQQTALEKLQKLLDKSDDLLNDEMNLTQILTENMKSLQSRFDNLQNRHGTLLADHEKLSYEFLQRKLDLEKLRMSHDDLRMENDSLLAQQISVAHVESIPPCLKCIERETANSSPESSNASIATNSSTARVVSNSSLEETTNVTDENAGLKELSVVIMESDRSNVFEGVRRGDLYIVDFSTGSLQTIFLKGLDNFGVKIKHIRSDNGTEFKNTGLDDYLDELDITHELSAPYTPQQNGVVERKNMTLVDMARTMLEEYQTPRCLWPEAINTACHIINRVYLHKFLKKTSYELLTDKKPDVVETIDVRFDETNGSQREQSPPDPDKLSPEEAIKLKATEDIVLTEEIAEEITPNMDENQEYAPQEIAPEQIPQPR
ncbi:hypothetical protein ZWY2020_010933 [Hordeum vulgare]|nr:hypothetical protein ZWY2020_010933 [Hordeum vulgare]